MTVFNKVKDEAELEEMHRSGQTPLTRRLLEIFTNPVAFRDDPHFEDFQRPGHLDVVDAQCAKILGMDRTTVEHISYEWPSGQKEMIRRAIVEAIRTGKPLVWSWRLSRSDQEMTEIHQAKKAIAVNLLSPRRAAVLAIRSRRSPARLSTSPSNA